MKTPVLPWGARWGWLFSLFLGVFLAAPTLGAQGPYTLTVMENGQSTTFTSLAPTVGEALWANGYRWYWADRLTPAAQTPLTTSLTLTLTLTHAQPLRVAADGQTLLTRSSATTVGEALGALGVLLLGEDYAVPASDQPLPTNGLVQVVRVTEARDSVQTPIAYETLYQAQADVEIDNTTTLQVGRNGFERTLTRIRYENGIEVSRVTEPSVLAAAPTPHIVGYGTKIVIRTLDTPDGPVEYWRAYTMYATSYAAKFFKVYSNRTASGMLLTKGVVAIDRTMMPFGTRMYVPDYGFAVAGDTGGGVKGRFIDLGFDDWNYVGWHSVVMVYFLTPVPPADQIRWIIPSTVP